MFGKYVRQQYEELFPSRGKGMGVDEEFKKGKKGKKDKKGKGKKGKKTPTYKVGSRPRSL